MRIILKPAGAIVVLIAIGILAFTSFRNRAAVPVAATPVPTPTPAQKTLALVAKPVPGDLIKNGAMSEGTFVPTSWDAKWQGKGKIVFSRDTTCYVDAPASLQLKTVDGPGEGQIAQRLSGKPGQKIHLAGFIRSEGNAIVHIGIQAHTAKFSPLSFQIVRTLDKPRDWIAFEKDVTLPPNTDHYGVTLYIKGDGKAWLDAVHVTPAK
jgi:hypothetical protein